VRLNATAEERGMMDAEKRDRGLLRVDVN